MVNSLGGEGSGPRTKFSDEYHQVLRKNVAESRKRQRLRKFNEKNKNMVLSLLAAVLAENLRRQSNGNH